MPSLVAPYKSILKGMSQIVRISPPPYFGNSAKLRPPMPPSVTLLPRNGLAPESDALRSHPCGRPSAGAPAPTHPELALRVISLRAPNAVAFEAPADI